MSDDVARDPQAGLRPAPRPSSMTKEFWDGASRGKLMLQYCRDAGKFQFYPRPVSIYTGKRNLEWREASGKGSVYTYTVTHRGPAPFRGIPPYIIATVELDEGVRMMSNLINCEAEDVRVGMRVRVAWTQAGEYRFPVFEPDR
jgi:uncharacterized OB-fold protein